MKKLLGKILCLLIAFSLVVATSGCGGKTQTLVIEQPAVEDMQFTGLNDERLVQYTQDAVFAYLEDAFESDDYHVEDVRAVYVSKEYLEELAYNKQKNVYFGYSIDEIKERLGDQRYVFTLDDDGATVVEARDFQGYDDTFNRVVTNVAIGGGVILVCVTVSVITGGAGAPVAVQTVHAIFAASAKTATTFAVSSAAIGGMTEAIVTGYETGDVEAAFKSGALGASQGFAVGAITGAVVGGAGKMIDLGKASRTIRSPRESELKALQKYGGREQVSYMNGEEVTNVTKGCTKPDIVRNIDGHLEAVEVKNYDLMNNYSQMKNVLKKQITARMKNLPEGSTQRVCIDIGGRNLPKQYLNTITTDLGESLRNIDPSVIVELMS